VAVKRIFTRLPGRPDFRVSNAQLRIVDEESTLLVLICRIIITALARRDWPDPFGIVVW
jgi:hypothetical protein